MVDAPVLCHTPADLNPVSRTASLWLLSLYPGADRGVWDDDSNWVFEATDRLRLDGHDADLRGADIAPLYRSDLRLIGTKATRVDDCRLSSCFAPFMKANRWICLGQRRWQQDGGDWMRFTTAEHWQEGA
ncbi:hypothetical protein [Azospirillum sp. A29]|uniref:hypothetical protein n=1 Tax=unclassified Azospirillum TaxID=2630922 RepID=UPI003673376B